MSHYVKLHIETGRICISQTSTSYNGMGVIAFKIKEKFLP